MEKIDMRPKHRMICPGLGIFIAPQGVARLFHTFDYRKCVRLTGKPPEQGRTLYPVLLPNVYYSPRFQQVSRQQRRYRNVY